MLASKSLQSLCIWHGDQSQAYSISCYLSGKEFCRYLMYLVFAWYGAVGYRSRRHYNWIPMAMTSTGLPEGRRFSGFLLPLESNMTVQIDSGMDLQQRFQGEKRFWWLNCREVTVHVLYQENLAMKFYRQGMLNVVSAMSMQVTWNVWPQDGRMRKTSVSWYTYQKQQDEL